MSDKYHSYKVNVPALKKKLDLAYSKAKKTARKRGRKMNNKLYSRVPRQSFGISKSVRGVHAYSQLYTYTAGSLGVFGGSQVWGLNTVFDPDKTGVGHFQYLRDQYAALYSRYKITGVRIEDTIADPSADGVVVVHKMKAPSDTSTVVGFSPTVVGEQPTCDLMYINNTGSQVRKYKRYYPMWKLCNLSKLQFDADFTTVSTITGANPALRS
jgi:hypothetical protein